ncbi:hypothetical protein AJ80_00692 [Polytolypa hystricis UAMH7299]|uniref:cyclin-dependent kinase n=1 Tax=Polytolypa hystricis (strain UAMH7299) TaxID=1447883 RepID=A0A2B7Z4C1_POLH7|nr:hypothetical protein AJ80_00692 [Polytolypa hystricis UAMH7299]
MELLLITESVPAEDITEYVDPRGPSTIFDVMIQCLRALNYLHHRNIIHRKSGSLRSESAKLTDFFGTIESKMVNGNFGHFAYRTPEMNSEGKAYTAAVDVWSLGIIFLQLWGMISYSDANKELPVKEKQTQEELDGGRMLHGC